jgi:hypothetical protein
MDLLEKPLSKSRKNPKEVVNNGIFWVNVGNKGTVYSQCKLKAL